MAQKKTMTVEGTQFGVYQNETGSFTSGEVRFDPLKVVAVAPESAADLDVDSAPVKLFAELDKAEADVEKLRTQFETRRKAALGRV